MNVNEHRWLIYLRRALKVDKFCYIFNWPEFLYLHDYGEAGGLDTFFLTSYNLLWNTLSRCTRLSNNEDNQTDLFKKLDKI